jgi:hypothetical protein
MKYEVNFQVLTVDEQGKEKRVKKLYLVDALSIIEAVTTATDEISGFFSEFECLSAKQVGYADVITNTEADDKYYHIKLNFITIDERTAVEKRSIHHLILQANDISEAKKRIEEEISRWVVDVEIVSISETKIELYIKK